MIFAFLVGCPSADPPPKPDPEPVIEAPEPEVANVRLDSGERADLRSGPAKKWSDISGLDGLVAHPRGKEIERYRVTPYIDDDLAVAFDEGKTWTVSADLNRDGKILAGEFVDLKPGEDGALEGQLRTATKRGPPVVDVPITLEVRVTGGKRNRQLHTRVESSRTCTLPGGTALHIQSHGGVYDTSETVLTIDIDGDGEVDLGNPLAQFSRDDGVLPDGDKVWAFELPADGGYLKLRETDSPVPGLRVGNTAPEFSIGEEEPKTLASFKGKPLLLTFTNADCPPCAAAAAELSKLATTHEAAALEIADTVVSEAYHVDTWPAHALVDAEGRLQALGSIDAIRKALGE